MPDVKISALPAATVPLAGTEVLPIVQSSTTRQVSVANLTAGRAISASSVTNSALTSGRVTYAGASGLLTDSANLLYSGTDLTVYGLTVGRGAGAIATNTVLGASALAFNSTGTLNIAIGANANKTTTGSNNIGIGQYTLGGNAAGATGSSNTGLGDFTMFQLTSGASNVAIGQSSQQFTSTGSYNVSVGNEALKNNSTASNNTAVGYQAGYSSTLATFANFFGYQAGYSFNVNDANSGTCFIGSRAGYSTTTGTKNTFLGEASGYSVTTGSGNTILGRYNGNQSSLDIRTASNYIVLSDGDGNPRQIIDGSGIVTMGAYGAGAATFSAAGVISSVSDETWKTKDGVPTNTDAMLQKLEPGYWFYNEEKAPTFGEERQLGFYAQNVHEAIGEEAAPTPQEGKPWGYHDRSVLAVAVMSLKNALNTIEELKQRITALENK